jgi:hypothetical protein
MLSRGWISEFEKKGHFALIIPNQSSLRFVPSFLPIVDFNALFSPEAGPGNLQAIMRVAPSS